MAWKLSVNDRLHRAVILHVILGAVIAPAAWADEAAFPACVVSLQAQALTAGISPAAVRDVLGKVQYQAKVIELDQRQPEFTQTFSDYYYARVTPVRIAQGRELLATHGDLLRRVAEKTGIAARYLVSFWGMETNYGRHFGNLLVPDVLATLACDPRRSTFFSNQLMDALRIIDKGDIAAKDMLGSWAGAMGHVQFMPSVFLRHAVDGDGDGHRDIWGSLPDAFFSAGNFLQSMGWQPGLRWGREVLLPEGFDYAQATADKTRPLDQWASLGITEANGQPLPKDKVSATLLVPTGHQGPAFLTYHNFNVIMGWNRSENYALSVGILADRIAGAEGLTQTPPRDLIKLTQARVKAMQAYLAAAGFDVGEPDGVFGPRTRSALSQFQKQQGLVPDGFPDAAVFDRMKLPLD